MQEVIDRLVDHIQWQLRDHWKNPTFENQRKAIREGLAIVQPYLEVAEKAQQFLKADDLRAEKRQSPYLTCILPEMDALRAAVDKLK